MSTAADRIRQNANRARSAATVNKPSVPTSPTPEVTEEAPKSVARPTTQQKPRTPLQRPVRKTVDLSPDENGRLGDWQRAAARDLGVARVTAQEVFTTLLDLLLTDESLSHEVRRKVIARR